MSNTTFTFDATIISDLHKDARGFRPSASWMADFNTASNERKQQIWDNLCRDLDEEMDREQREQTQAIESLERGIASAIMLGAADRETALRWIVEGLELDAFDLQYGGSYICFRMGLPYTMQGIFDPICKDLLAKMSRED